MSTVIKFENISKQYRLGLVSTQTISHDLNRWWKTSMLGKEDPYLMIGDVNDRSIKAQSDYVWALKNIDFEVQQGDVLGIIGKNGSGKSTLLKILSKITAPTTGSISHKGRIAALLEVGTGFHPEMTGRENIYLNGAILGMTKVEITRKLDEIVDFSGIERYIDTPSKRYSSGMYVRLGFAIAAHLDPEIMIVDEVLAVGDAEFQKKAIGKMQDVSRGEGRTVLFVSHNMPSIRSLCNKCVILENGSVKNSGKIDDMVDLYIKGNFDPLSRSSFWDINSDQAATIIEVSIHVDGKDNTQLIDINDKIKVCIKYFIKENLKDTNIAFSLYKEGLLIFNTWDIDTNQDLSDHRGKGLHITEFYLPSNLLNGFYDVSVGLGRPNIGVISSRNNCLAFEIENIIEDGTNKSFTRGGLFKTEINWNDQIIH